MAATTGAFHEATAFAAGHNLPVTFVVEDNGYSTNTPTREAWGPSGYVPALANVIRYTYERTRPHVGIGRHVRF
jgi:TPP-dependent pyruvate/acetoin dehydrogenase alpha subunit